MMMAGTLCSNQSACICKLMEVAVYMKYDLRFAEIMTMISVNTMNPPKMDLRNFSIAMNHYINTAKNASKNGKDRISWN